MAEPIAANCRSLGWATAGLAAMALSVGCSSSSSGKSSTMRMPWSKKAEVPAKPAGYKGSKAGDRDPFLNPSGKDIPPPESIGGVAPKPKAEIEALAGHDGNRTDASAISLVAARRDADESAFADYAVRPAAILKPDAAPRGFKYIVLHQSNGEAGNLAAIDADHRQRLGWESCGFHFVIGNGRGAHDGEIEVGQRWTKQRQGAHVTGKSVADFNLAGIGICLIGDFDKDRPSPRQVEAARNLVAYLMRTYNIPPYRVLTHDEVNGDDSHGQKCPGALFQLDQVLPMQR